MQDEGARPPSPREVNELLESLDPYIRRLASKRLPREMIPSTQWADDIEELIQKTRIKVWEALCRGSLTNPHGYIGAIIRTEAIDMIRFYQRVLPLVLNEEGEPLVVLSIAQPLFSLEVQDPAEIVEQAEAAAECAELAATHIMMLPHCQRYALIDILKQRIRDILPLVERLKCKGLDITDVSLPTLREKGKNTASTSLWIARKKLRLYMHRYASVRKRFSRANS
jgi:DNA-directed RNA polymerase specialized sigma24 family protein